MSSRKILINGVEYLRLRDAARAVGLVADYVSRLARENLIDGRQVEGVWFISLTSLKSFVAEQDRLREIRRIELAQQRRDEQRAAGHPSALKALFT
jgi:hypothetical protein